MFFFHHYLPIKLAFSRIGLVYSYHCHCAAFLAILHGAPLGEVLPPPRHGAPGHVPKHPLLIQPLGQEAHQHLVPALWILLINYLPQNRFFCSSPVLNRFRNTLCPTLYNLQLVAGHWASQIVRPTRCWNHHTEDEKTSVYWDKAQTISEQNGNVQCTGTGWFKKQEAFEVWLFKLKLAELNVRKVNWKLKNKKTIEGKGKPNPLLYFN